MEILLTGNRIDAREAYRIGLVNHVLPARQVMAKAEELAATIVANGPLAVRAIKEAVVKSSGGSLAEGFAIENRLAKEVFSSDDAKEGPHAFMEKRKPNFTGN
jgi:enoyl-CoA hydratase